jgi:oxygen-independent coproporphyrinogen-3 oxidase
LIVEPGTRLAARVARGEVPNPSDDVAAHRYELIDEKLHTLGMTWYEVSNWAKPGGECRHNIAYWRNQDWLGIGPGAHAHSAGTRSWNLKHPAAWAAKVDEGVSAAADREVLEPSDIRHEEIMLGLRLREGLPLSTLVQAGLAQAKLAVDEGLLVPEDFAEGKAVLTFKGRLLADGLVARLWA